MNLINLTPHEIVVLAQDGTTVLGKIAPSGVVSRVAATRKELGVIPISSDAAAALRGDIGASIPVYGVESLCHRFSNKRLAFWWAFCILMGAA